MYYSNEDPRKRYQGREVGMEEEGKSLIRVIFQVFYKYKWHRNMEAEFRMSMTNFISPLLLGIASDEILYFCSRLNLDLRYACQKLRWSCL